MFESRERQQCTVETDDFSGMHPTIEAGATKNGCPRRMSDHKLRRYAEYSQ